MITSHTQELPILRKPIKLGHLMLIPLLMFGFAFLMVPLYDTLCDLTGFNGRSSSLSSYNQDVSNEIKAVDKSRTIAVNMLTSVAAGMPIRFYAKESDVKLNPGELKTMIFVVENRSENIIVGQAIPSVTPPQAALHFKKLECFCFQEQEFAPGDTVEMPVRFTIDSNVQSNIKDVSLSYTFFLKEVKKPNMLSKSIVKTHAPKSL